MGMELVELVIAVEDAFKIHLPNQDASEIHTPGQLVDYIEASMQKGSPMNCLEGRAFYRLRKAGVVVLSRPRSAFKPETPWAELLQPGEQNRQWEQLKEATGITPWPRLKPLFSWGPPRQTLGQTARTIATTAPASILEPTESLSRESIEGTVSRLMYEVCAVSQFKWTDRFVVELGLG